MHDSTRPDDQPDELDLAGFIAALRDPSTVVLDAQGPGRYEIAHVPGSVPIDWYDIDPGLRARSPHGPGTRVVVYCTDLTCTGSAIAAEHLIAKGWTNVARFAGGLAEWCEAGGNGRAAKPRVSDVSPSS